MGESTMTRYHQLRLYFTDTLGPNETELDAHDRAMRVLEGEMEDPLR